jgi:ABC-type transport system involved in multi-copper enzyme maturation permease subunit
MSDTLPPIGKHDDATDKDVPVVVTPVAPPPAVATAPVAAPGRHPIRVLRRTGSGISAVGVKELRGRMRGRRAFVILTLYLLLLGGFAWMYELILAAKVAVGVGGSAAYASALIGQEIFGALLILITLLVVFLAPAFTAGAISLEREKQTLDMLVTTPISSLAIVIGKLLSALTYVFILIAASIPITAIVFVFGGVAPDDVIRGYLVLVATALGLGTFGLFCSTIVKRTQAATVVTVFGVLAMTLGSIFILYFWNVMAGISTGGQTGFGPIKGRAPEVIAYLNPFLAQADIICGTQTTYGEWCSRYSEIMGGQSGIIFTSDGGGAAVPEPAVFSPDGTRIANVGIADVSAFGVSRDQFWPKTVIAWLVASVVMIALSIQLVAPTRRWRPRIPRRRAKATAA